MKLGHILWRGVTVCVLLLLLFIAGTLGYDRIQLYRAQRMLDALKRTTVNGLIRDSELDKFLLSQECSATTCVQEYEVLSPYLDFLSRYDVPRSLPGWRDWWVQARVESKEGKLLSRKVETWWQPGGMVAMSPVARFQQGQNEERCDPAEVLRHPGYSVWRNVRHGLVIDVKRDAPSSVVESVFDLRLSCLSNFGVCFDKVAPRAAADKNADATWRASHENEALKVCDGVSVSDH